MALPPQNYAKYRWQRVPGTEPALFQRCAAGAEHYMHWAHQSSQSQDAIRGQGQGAILLHLDVVCEQAVPATTFLAAARQAWMALRFTAPMIAASTGTAPDGDSLIMYRVATGEADVTTWAERTVQFQETPVPGNEHATYERWRVWEDTSDQAVLLIRPCSERAYEVTLLTGHVWTDGTGIKTLASRLLATLARYLHDDSLATREHAAMRWGEEDANLLPAFTEILGEGESLEGPEFDATLGQIVEDLMTTFPRALMYQSHTISGAESRGSRLDHNFTEDQTRQIIRYAKERGFSVNQLINAAVYLTVLHDNPSAVTDETVLVGHGAVNTRARLRAPYNTHLGYPGFCLNSTALIVPMPDVREVSEDARLDVVAGVLKREYARQKAYPALLGVSAQLGAMLVAGEQAQQYPWAGPWFHGDGIAERDLDPDYMDDAGLPVLSIADFYLHVRPQIPCIMIRAHSWRGWLKISASYNEAFKPQQVVENVMRDMIKMLSFTGAE